jgi:hypothetical protein
VEAKALAGDKKNTKRAAHDRFHRRKRIERAPAPLSHLGAERADAGAAISLQLEDTVGDGRGAWWNFYFRLFPGAIAARRSSCSFRI